MTNAVTTLASLTQLPSSNIAPTEVAKYSTAQFLRRVQLVTKGKLVDQQIVAPGNYAIPDDDTAEDLGDHIDVLVLAVRHKAMDTNVSPPVVSYDAGSELFKEIVTKAGTKDSGCMFGPSFLVFERKTAQFLELFLGNESGRQEAKKLVTFLPVSEEVAKATGLTAQGPQVCTLRSRFIKKPRYSWHVPVANKCSTPIENLPPLEEIVAEINKFLNPKTQEAEVADKKAKR